MCICTIKKKKIIWRKLKHKKLFKINKELMFPGKTNKYLRQQKINRLIKEHSNFDLDIVDVVITTPLYNVYGVDFKSIISNEIVQKVSSQIYKYLFENCSNIIELDLSDEKIDIDINFKENKYLISNAQSSLLLQDMKHYNINMQTNTNPLFYNFGSILNYDLYINQFMTWNDNQFLILDKRDFYTLLDFTIEPYSSSDIVQRYKIKTKIIIDKTILENIKIIILKNLTI